MTIKKVVVGKGDIEKTLPNVNRQRDIWNAMKWYEIICTVANKQRDKLEIQQMEATGFQCFRKFSDELESHLPMTSKTRTAGARHNVQHQVACVSRKGTIIPAGIAPMNWCFRAWWMLLNQMLPGFQRWRSWYAASGHSYALSFYQALHPFNKSVSPNQIRTNESHPTAPSSACGIQILHVLRHGAILISGIQLLHLQPVGQESEEWKLRQKRVPHSHKLIPPLIYHDISNQNPSLAWL